MTNAESLDSDSVQNWDININHIQILKNYFISQLLVEYLTNSC